MPLRLTTSEIWETVVKLGEAHPAARYDKGDLEVCSYIEGSVQDDEGFVGAGCLVGQAIVLLAGNEVPDWLVANQARAVSDLAVEVGFADPEDRHLRALQAAQNAQDVGESWGYAVKSGTSFLWGKVEWLEE